VNNYEKNLDRVKDSNVEISLNYDLTIQAMARALEYRDLETAGHSVRVVELSTQLAYVLGFPEQEVEQLQRGALLHDIGKLAIPDNILLKPGKFNEKEIKIMQRHPEYGRELLKGISFLETAIPVVYSHHERWDGNGYPDGLKGEQIPLSARIFSIIDNWDALTSDRPYRKAWSREKTENYIAENSGIMFDPNIAMRFLEMISSQR
jgi:putative nucleotidyltransferase with HDIG domain